MSKKYILLCATDAGGARNILPLTNSIKKISNSYEVLYLISKKMFSYHNYAFIDIIDKINTHEMACNYLRKINPKAIICGTTRYMSPERYLTLAGRELNIRTIAILDEWFNYSLRFQNSKGEYDYLPDALAVMDNLAKEEANDSGIPGELCYVTGSPSLASLTDIAEEYMGKPPPYPSFIKAYSGKVPIITFLSETHGDDYGKYPGETGPLGPYLGYTEDIVRDNILRVLTALNKECVLIEKIHPSAHIKGDGLRIINDKIHWFVVKDINLWDLLWHSDAAIGMRSMALLEACILGCKAVSFQPGLIDVDNCSAVRLGLVKRIDSLEALEQWCRLHIFNNCSELVKTITRFPFAPKDAAQNVVKLALR